MKKSNWENGGKPRGRENAKALNLGKLVEKIVEIKKVAEVTVEMFEKNRSI